MTIWLKCLNPKYAKGEYQFTTFEDFARWIANLKSARGWVGAPLCALAEVGSYNNYDTRFSIEAKSDLKFGYPAKELAYKVGVIRARGYGRDVSIALQFAKELDKLGFKGVQGDCPLPGS